MKRILFGFILVFLLASCTKQKELNYTVKEVNGHKVIKNRNIPADENLTIKTKELFTIKGFDDSFADDSLRILPDMIAVDLDSENNIYILSHKKALVNKFDSKGTFIKSIGHKGTGPGGTRNPMGMYILNDTLNVVNATKLEVVKYGTEGEFIENISTKECKIPIAIEKIGKDKLTAYLCVVHQEDDGYHMDYDLGLITPKYDILKRLKKQTYPMKIVMSQPIEKFYGLTATGGKLYIASKSIDRYLIDVFGNDGEQLYSITKSFMKIKADKKMVKSSKNSIKFKKAICELLSDNKGRVWSIVSLERNEQNKDDFLVDVFDNGIFQNRVKIDIPINAENRVSNDMFIRGNKLFIIDSQNVELNVYEYEVVSS